MTENVVVLADTVPPSLCNVNEDIGQRVVTALGEPAARELLEVLERSDEDRAALIGRLHARSEAAWLAELLMNLEDEVGEVARLRLAEACGRSWRGDGTILPPFPSTLEADAKDSTRNRMDRRGPRSARGQLMRIASRTAGGELTRSEQDLREPFTIPELPRRV